MITTFEKEIKIERKKNFNSKDLEIKENIELSDLDREYLLALKTKKVDKKRLVY